MEVTAKGVDCEVVEWVKLCALKRLYFMMIMTRDGIVKRAYENRIEGKGVQGRPPVKWLNRVNENWRKRVGKQRIECVERECWNREAGGASAMAIPLQEQDVKDR